MQFAFYLGQSKSHALQKDGSDGAAAGCFYSNFDKFCEIFFKLDEFFVRRGGGRHFLSKLLGQQQ